MTTGARLAGGGYREIKEQGGWRDHGTAHGYFGERCGRRFKRQI